MPTATNGGIDLQYATDGPADADPVVFVEDAGLGAWLWGWQAPALAGRFRTVVPDLRGTGRSDAPEGPYAVDDLAADLEAVLADVGARRAHLVGSGLGGMVALQYAHEYGRAATLTLLGTAAAGADLADDPGRDRTAAARLCGDPDDRGALRTSLDALLSDDFLAAQPDAAEGILDWRMADDAGPEACEWQVAAMEGFDLRDELYEVTEPALVIHGSGDLVVPVEAGERLADGLPRGEFERFEGAGHLVGVERSRPVNDRIWAFLDRHVDDEWDS